METRKLIIRHIGAISEIEIDLTRVNVFMGKQGSGKSTIAKIYSFCSWLEKSLILNVAFTTNYLEELKNFHRFSDGYFNADSYIEFQTSCFKMEWKVLDVPKFHLTIGTKNVFNNNKIIYIPAERNFVAAIPNLGKYNETTDNIMNLLYDWFTAKQAFQKSTKLSIPGLDANYYYTKENDTDLMQLADGKEITLQTASSGFQSLVPLITLIDYILKIIYTKEKSITPFERLKIEELIKHIDEKLAENTTELIANYNDLIDNLDADFRINKKDEINKLNEGLFGLIKTYGIEIRYQYSQLIIEEPEQNLFPETQRDLIYYLLQTIQSDTRDHRLILTTHSPYILYALNNCMLGGLVGENLTETEKEKLQSVAAWLKPEEVSVWQIKEDGTVVSIKDKRTGTIGKHYFNEVMNSVMNEYYALLKHLKVTN